MLIDPHKRSLRALKRREKKKRDYRKRIGPLVKQAKEGDVKAARQLARMGIKVRSVGS